MEKVIVNDVDITDYITSFEMYDEMDNDMIIGSSISTQVKMTLKNKDNQLIDLLNYPFVIGNKTYIIYEKPEKWTKTISLTLYDKMILTNIAYDTHLVYPTTVSSQLYEMEEMTGVKIDQSSLSDEVLSKTVGWYDTTIAVRNYIGFIAQCDGKNACIIDDQITFLPIAKNKISVDFCSGYELNELITFTRVCYDNGVTLPLYKGNQSKHTLYFSSNNSYVDQNDVDRVYDMYNDLSFYSFKNMKIKDSSVKITDLVSYGDITVMPLSLKRTVYGGEAKDALELSGDVTIKNADSVLVTYDQNVKIKKIQTIVDQNTQTIEIIALEQEQNNKKISEFEISLDGITSEVSKVYDTIYKFETGSNNIFENCNQVLMKTIEDSDMKQKSDMPLGINADFMKGKDICISVDIDVLNAKKGYLGNYIGAEFDIGYSDGTKKTYFARWYLGQYLFQYLLQTDTSSHHERIWVHYTVDDKEIASVSNLRMIIALDAEKAIVSNPKVEFGTYPTGFEFDMNTVRDNIETIQKDYTQISQAVDTLSLKAVSMEEQITTVQGDVSSITTRIQSAEIKLQPTNILLAVNEQIGANGTLYTTKFVLDKNGVHISGGGLDIQNNSGAKVLYADTSGNLVINNLTATNGNFSGKITGGTITIGNNFKVDSSGNLTAKGNASFQGNINGSAITGGTINGTTITTDKDLHVGNNIYVGTYNDRNTKKYIYLNDRFSVASRNDVLCIGLANDTVFPPGTLNFTSNGSIYLKGTSYLRLESDDSKVSSIMLADGTINMSSQPVVGSDVRLKENIQKIDLVEMLNYINVYRFNYKGSNKKTVGVIAQDFIGSPYEDIILSKDSRGYYAVDYNVITMTLVQKVMELNNQIRDMQVDFAKIGGMYGIKY